MDFRLDDDQQALQTATREFCRKEITLDRVRRAFEGPDGDDADLDRELASMGWVGMTVPEDRGGLGMGLVEQAVVCEELGYVNAPGGYFSTACLAIPVVLALGADDLLEALLDGSKRATVAMDHDIVVDAQLADGFILESQGRLAWYDRDEVDVTPHESLDGTRRTGSVRPRGAGRELGPLEAVDDVIDGATAVLCAEMVGGMQRVLDDTVAYVKDREQFAKPIGSFQAVQHRCADMLVQTEGSRSATYYAAYANAYGEPDAAYASSVAKAYTSDASHFVTGEGIQLHGGIGFTWEHHMHFYFKRSTLNQVLLGDAAYHRERALQLDPEAGIGAELDQRREPVGADEHA